MTEAPEAPTLAAIEPTDDNITGRTKPTTAAFSTKLTSVPEPGEIIPFRGQWLLVGNEHQPQKQIRVFDVTVIDHFQCEAA